MIWMGLDLGFEIDLGEIFHEHNRSLWLPGIRLWLGGNLKTFDGCPVRVGNACCEVTIGDLGEPAFYQQSIPPLLQGGLYDVGI